MTITVKLFALLRDRAGAAETTLELRDGASVADAAAALGQKFPAIADFLPRTAFAVNQSYVSKTEILHAGDELALIPPVSGG